MPGTPLRLVSSVIVGAVLFPLSALIYLLLKLFGSCWIVTNRTIQQRNVIGGRLTAEVALGDVAEIEITQRSGYRFFRVGDIHLFDAQGNRQMTIPAIQYPARMQHVIMEARDARLQSDQSLQVIQARTA